MLVEIVLEFTLLALAILGLGLARLMTAGLSLRFPLGGSGGGKGSPQEEASTQDPPIFGAPMWAFLWGLGVEVVPMIPADLLDAV